MEIEAEVLEKKPKRKTTKKKNKEETTKEAVKDVVLDEIVPEVASPEEKNAVIPELNDTNDNAQKKDRYFEAVGRRKTAVARVRIFTKQGDFIVNGKLYSAYFPTLTLQKIVEDALQKMKLFGRFRVSVILSGGGSRAQAEALRHGIARALTKFNPDFRKRLKRAGFLRRDPRMKERKKFGLKKARRAPQWQKR
jgi:small subunit ribosomal protein S9